MKRVRYLRILVVCLLAIQFVGTGQAAFGQESGCGPNCGEERWAVKTLTDNDAAKVNFSPIVKTVGELVAVKAPNGNSEISRLNATEETTFQIRARLVGYKHETDRDFHIVIAGSKNPLSGQHPRCGFKQFDAITEVAELADHSGCALLL